MKVVKQDPDLERFKAFRREHQLPFDEKFVPASFENLVDLEDKYFRREEAAKATPPKAKSTSHSVTRSLLKRELDVVIDAVGDVLRRLRNEDQKKIANLEKRLGAIEAAPSLRWLGVWNPKSNYRPGDVVTSAGSLWHCNSCTENVKPGTNKSAWTLAVKRVPPGKEEPE